MNQNGLSAQASEVRLGMKKSFARKGIMRAIGSGITYGIYSGFLTLGLGTGVWVDFYSGEYGGVALSSFFLIYILGAMGSAVNDTISGIYRIICVAAQGLLKDWARTLKTKPGRILIFAGFIGGPIGASAYTMALQSAGSIIVPIAALNAALGAILGRILFKQPLNARIIGGILICFIGAFLIAYPTLTDLQLSSKTVIGMVLAFVCALAWGFEGCVGGYATCMVDPKIAITIRQVTSGLGNLIIVIPALILIGGESFGFTYSLIFDAFTSMGTFPWLVLGGIFGAINYGWWYKGAGMCGAALGMACNGMYAFWSPLFIWLIVGVCAGQEGWAMPPIAWIAAVVIALGILVIAMNPLDLFRKKEVE